MMWADWFLGREVWFARAGKKLSLKSLTSNPMLGKEIMVHTTSNSGASLGNPGPTLELEDSTGS